jgi:hypothetical protein
MDLKLYERMRLWALGVGIRQLHLSEERGWQIADHMRHFNHHLVQMRKCRPDQDGLFIRHLSACGNVLSKIAFEAALKGVDLDHDEHIAIQKEIVEQLKLIANDDDSDFIPHSVADSVRVATDSP